MLARLDEFETLLTNVNILAIFKNIELNFLHFAGKSRNQWYNGKPRKQYIAISR